MKLNKYLPLSILLCFLYCMIWTTVICMKFEKETVTTQNSNFRSHKTSKSKVKLKCKCKTKNKLKNKLKNKQNSSQAPFFDITAIQLLKDFGQKIFNNKNDANIFSSCIDLLKDKSDKSIMTLSNFWSSMAAVSVNPSQWNNNYIQEVLNSIINKNIFDGQKNISCGDLKIAQNIDNEKINSLLNQGQYFGGFVTSNKPKQPFIEGMVSHHRDHIDSNTFENINKVSRESGPDSKQLENLASLDDPNNRLSGGLNSGGLSSGGSRRSGSAACGCEDSATEPEPQKQTQEQKPNPPQMEKEPEPVNTQPSTPSPKPSPPAPTPAPQQKQPSPPSSPKLEEPNNEEDLMGGGTFAMSPLSLNRK